MFASPFQRFLINLRKELPEQSLYYMSKEEAYQSLRELSGKDFGYDDKLWEKWGLENHQFLPGYEPPKNENEESSKGSGVVVNK